MSVPRSWDVFCHVIDNFGDAAVCWRLARALAAITPARAENRAAVRLWIDDLASLRAMQPEVVLDAARQSVDGVEICHWVDGADFGESADVAVDAFACGLADDYAQAMAARSPKALWIVLEYLSAEPWVEAHHGLPSPHPRLPVERYFFFPGFGAGAGGLLREPGLGERRESFLRDARLPQTFWQDTGFAAPDSGASVISLFGYENPVVGELLDTWACGEKAIVAAVPHSRLSADIAAYFDAAIPPAGTSLRRGALEVRFLPFLTQDRYDQLLWVADWNFVRGEDSFVRAQWAERPFVWHIYPQSGDVQHAKLAAFLELYCGSDRLAEAFATPLRTLWLEWNDEDRFGAGSAGRAWSELARHEGALRRHAHNWARKAAATGDLAINLAKFCQERLK